MARTTTTLVHPDGKREYTTSDPSEITRLKAHGYAEKTASKTKQAKPANKAATPADK